MSIKRHTAAGSGVVRTDPKGDLVLYADYARLKAEVERLTGQSTVEQLGTLAPSNLVHYWMEQANIHKAQVERLTEAGDELEKRYFEYATPDDAVKAWHAAKEGKQP